MTMGHWWYMHSIETMTLRNCPEQDRGIIIAVFLQLITKICNNLLTISTHEKVKVKKKLQ